MTLPLGQGSPYQGYTYAYPHKTAYRPLEPAPSLAEVWREERQDALFLYVHVPFCEMRCGFCNLFTEAIAQPRRVARFLDALERQAGALREVLDPEARFARFAIGGGTPTYLDARALDRLFEIVTRRLGARLEALPIAVETSPATATADRLAVLAGHGVGRISIGIQSFVDVELASLGRPQRRQDVERALRSIRHAGFETLNVDLIYGVAGQTVESLDFSLERTLAYDPEEIFLYPLYVRPLTGLGRRSEGGPEADARLALYRHARDTLLDCGYQQVSMRMFRRTSSPPLDGPAYCCQEDGMVGLGPGARSYTRSLHYSGEYAVSRSAVRGIVDDYCSRDEAGFARAEVGFRLGPDEQRRRYLLQSLLQSEGLRLEDYQRRFGSSPADDVAELAALLEAGWVVEELGRLRLRPERLERSDEIGPWLYSPAVRARSGSYVLR